MEREERFSIIDRIDKMPSVNLSPSLWFEISTLASGNGDVARAFAGRKEYEHVFAALRAGKILLRLQPLLIVDEDEEAALDVPGEVILRDLNGKNIALMHLSEKFRIDADYLKLIVEKNEDSDTLIHEYLRCGYGLAIAGDIELVSTEKEASSAGQMTEPAEARKGSVE
jgi:ATP sulfurylase